jgi:hypothetical protein
MSQSHTELAAQALKWRARIQDRWFMLSHDTTVELVDLFQQLAAALESPERVQGEAAAAHEVLRTLYLSANPREDIDLELVERIAQLVVDHGLAASDVAAHESPNLSHKVATPSPQAEKQPLSDEQIDALPWGPHEGNPITFAEGLRYFARAVEAAHGIVTKESTNG